MNPLTREAAQQHYRQVQNLLIENERLQQPAAVAV
jgi:hypothetical protein